ncbi:hypothetical protein [Streptomyces sp. NPDC016626]|uniref:hypothetical protein n=1 Tax=Streptomyces sp. NPDC016626 TaxID=3364968 RepID=UPI003701FA77
MSVQMRHDGIEEPIEVPEISVRHYERSGWQVVGDLPVPVEETAAAKVRRRSERTEG